MDQHQTQLADKRSAEFSSENFKIEVANLPKKIRYHQAKQIFENFYKLNCHKIKVAPTKAYITFKSQEERDSALDILAKKDWRGSFLEAKVSGPNDRLLNKFASIDAEEGDDISPSAEEINCKVCPFWNKTYQEQLKYKDQSMRQALNFKKKLLELCRDIKIEQVCPDLNEWLNKNDKICCDFQGVVPSPVVVGYRNKCEFNVDQNGTVGFKLGRYKDGSERVHFPPENCPIINKKMFQLLNAFQKFLRNENKQTKLRGFSHITHQGHVRQLTLRTNENNESMIIIDLDPQDLSKEELDSEINEIINMFRSIEGVVSIYINISEREHFVSDQTMRLVFGESHLYENLRIDDDSCSPLKFRVGPSSFFQINTKAAELLYRSIIELAGLDSSSLVLDMGCGTGTISLSLARKVYQVIGVEVVKSAIEDAKLNAKINNISNALFFCGRAEDLINETITILRSKQSEQISKRGEIVAICDPPRQGFNNSFIKALRASNHIKKIIYVACDPLANSNLLSLCRPKSKSYQGDPFVPTVAKAFDLFPQTKFCELVLVYERLESSSSSSSQLVTRLTTTVASTTPATTTESPHMIDKQSEATIQADTKRN